MTTSKWIGTLGALFVAIFGLTFVSNYLAQPKADDTDSTATDDLPTLTVPITKYPYLARSLMVVDNYELEHRKPGYQDYWFQNESDQKITVGAIEKSCKCQGVEVCVMPEGYPMRMPQSLPQPNIALPLGLLGRRAFEAHIEQLNSDASTDSEAKKESTFVLNKDDPNATAEVPPHRTGWIRMRWTGEKAGKMNLTAKLWLHHPGSGVEVGIERMADFVEPVRIPATDLKFASKRMEDLPFSSSFFIWSSTRQNFKITKAEAGRPAGMPASADPFAIGEPVPLTVDQCIRLSAMLNQGRVLSGYQIPVMLQKVAPDGKSTFDIGNFRRRVEVRTDASDKPLFTTFNGVIQGDLHVSGVDDSGGIAFNSFRRDSRPKRFALIHTDNPAVNLELDKSRVPEYLSAALTHEPNPAGTGAGPSDTWKLEVVVLPNAYGPFPRDDDPAYRDAAVYVRTVEKLPHTVRVAIKGDASDR
jgi:hypothetical protein